MDKQKWESTDRYITANLLPSDPILESTLAANAAAGLPSIDVSPAQGKFLNLLAKAHGSCRILEIGTLGGYSTIWLARALPPGGLLVTLELDPGHAQVARENLAHAHLSELVEIRIGPAAKSLESLHAEGTEPFDLIFIDADKPNNPTYLRWALKLSKLGSMIIVDNVIREGAVADPADPDPRVQGSRALFEALASEPRLSSTAIQTVGSKGYDGFAMALVVAD